MEDQAEISKHIKNAAKTTAAMQFDHLYKSSRLQNRIAGITAIFSKPIFTPMFTTFIITWIAFNSIMPLYGYKAIDPAPFHILSFCSTIFAIHVSLIILTTQHRDEEISWQREELSLQLAILNEQKTSKLIQLVDDLRKSQMDGEGIIDDEANAMSSSEDLKQVQESVRKNRDKIFEADKAKV